jgi:hypothetical protein
MIPSLCMRRNTLRYCALLKITGVTPEIVHRQQKHTLIPRAGGEPNERHVGPGALDVLAAVADFHYQNPTISQMIRGLAQNSLDHIESMFAGSQA